MKFDITFIDVVCPRPYDTVTLETQPLGGSEASLVRVAESLAAQGLKVGVFQHNRDIEAMDKAYYLPISYLNQITKVKNVVSFRSIRHLDQFPRAKRFTWHEDLAPPQMSTWRDFLIDNEVVTIAASKWHKEDIAARIYRSGEDRNPIITHIYNPVPDSLYVPGHIDVKYDKNKIVWLSSPHKGLDVALRLFKEIKRLMPDMQLHTFNPGYFDSVTTSQPGVYSNGPVPCKRLWQETSEALAVFYPCTFKETFGCIAAEANAVHTPVATYKLAALNETVNGENQLVSLNDEAAIVERIVSWHKGYRPNVVGKNEFKLSEVTKRWIKYLE